MYARTFILSSHFYICLQKGLNDHSQLLVGATSQQQKLFAVFNLILTRHSIRLFGIFIDRTNLWWEITLGFCILNQGFIFLFRVLLDFVAVGLTVIGLVDLAVLWALAGSMVQLRLLERIPHRGVGLVVILLASNDWSPLSLRIKTGRPFEISNEVFGEALISEFVLNELLNGDNVLCTAHFLQLVYTRLLLCLVRFFNLWRFVIIENHRPL